MMHMQMFGVVMHVTILAIVGYFILFTASKAEGLVSLLGKILALWVFLLAIAGVVCAVTGHGPMGGDMKGHPWMHSWGAPPAAAPMNSAPDATPKPR